MTPPTGIDEAQTREQIDCKLALAGWAIQDKSRINLYASLGVAVREMDTDTDTRFISRASFRKKLALHNLIGAVKGSDTSFLIEI